MKFIVILFHQNGSAVPMMREDQYTMHEFNTAAEASEHARMTNFGHAFGFNVVRWDYGIVEVL